MDLELRDRVAIVTASAGGIGAAIALELAREGARVAVSTDHNVDGGEAVVARIRNAGGDAFFARCDVAHEDQVATLVDQTVRRYGRLDVLVNNAAVQRFAAIETMDRAEWDWIFAVNLTGPAMACKHAVPHMKAVGGGSIVNISSVHDVATAALMGAYPATKSGLCGLTRVLALELGPANIRVNAISPGYIDTPMFRGDAVRQGGGDAQVFIDRLSPTIALRRIGRPEETASLVAFLASPRGAYITGSSIMVDGGVSIQL